MDVLWPSIWFGMGAVAGMLVFFRLLVSRWAANRIAREVVRQMAAQESIDK